MNKTDRDNWRKFLGIKDPQTALDAARIGGDIGKTAGRAGGSVGGGSFDGENPPEGEDEEGAEKGDGGADAGEKLKVGDKFDRLEDLYDCETGEKVTIDGFGEEGSESYPNGFENCDKPKKPTMAELEANNVIIYRNSISFSVPPAQGSGTVSYYYYASEENANSGLNSLKSNVNSYAESHSQHGCPIFTNENIGVYIAWAQWKGITGAAPCDASLGYAATVKRDGQSTSTEWRQAYLDNWQDNWPKQDKNHLNWNKEKGCFEPLCPELNTAVSDKFKECQKEHVLCDKDGNKVKVEVDGNGVKITQAKYNQTAEFRNGKVTAVKKLTESQTEAEFK